MGEKPRLTVNAREAVRLFRSGMSDSDLMKRYNISARSPERLFKKLLDEGEIEKAELNRRLFRSERSHIVDVVSDTVVRREETQKKKVRISAGDVLDRIRYGMSDIELMDHYNLSARGLDRLLKRLVRRGDIVAEDLKERKRAFHWAEIAFVKTEGQSPETLDEDSGENDDGAVREFAEEHKVVISGLLGALCGMLLTVVFIVSLAGSEATWGLLTGPKHVASTAGGSGDPLDDAAQQVISTLEAIASGAGPEDTSESGPQSPEYERCLKNCDSDHSGDDDADKILRVSCRKDCVARYSKRLKAIRELYHGRRPGDGNPPQ